MEAKTADVLAGKVRCSQCSKPVVPGVDSVETLSGSRGVLGAQFTCHRCDALTMVDITDPDVWQAKR